MIEFLFLDLDDTILDFHKAERIALGKTLRHFGVEPTDAVCALYSEINKAHWRRLEKKELTREQVLLGRFETLFAQLGVSAVARECADTYEGFLSQGHYFLPGAPEALEKLHGKYRLFLASNGTARVQAGRLESAGIGHYFEKIFISQEIGANKPAKEYFDGCFAQIPDFSPERAMMVGDSLSSDILGGMQAGILTCWVNPSHAVGNIKADYEIEGIHQLYDLLEQL